MQAGQTAEYVVALRREQRATAPADWLERISRISGVQIEGRYENRATIEADPAGLAALTQELGWLLLIEPAAERHYPPPVEIR